jgi:hypothetical protein
MRGQPLPNGPNGERDGLGRFAKGNAGGPGNPNARSVNRWRAILAESVTDAQIKAVIGRLVEAAKRGEPWAIKEFLDRVLGKPIQPLSHEVEDDTERWPIRIIFQHPAEGDGGA